jgi:predicted nucleic acid-binding protein
VVKYVVDANIGIKWVIPEIHSDYAWGLRNIDYQLLVPDFFFPEIANIFWKKVRRKELSLNEAVTDLKALMDLPLIKCPSYPLIGQALEIAVRIQQAVYDCVYLSLAVQNNCQMVTADERFLNALKGDGLFDYLCWVEDLPDNL